MSVVFRGIITDADTGLPIENATVVFTFTNIPSYIFPPTDSLGEYYLLDLGLTNKTLYYMKTYAANYPRQRKNINTYITGGTYVNDQAIYPGGTVSGAVTDKTTGVPIKNLRVTIFNDYGVVEAYLDDSGNYDTSLNANPDNLIVRDSVCYGYIASSYTLYSEELGPAIVAYQNNVFNFSVYAYAIVIVQVKEIYSGFYVDVQCTVSFDTTDIEGNVLSLTQNYSGFRFEKVKNGVHNITVSVPGHIGSSETVTIEIAKTTTIELNYTKTIKASGYVLDQDTGQPIEGMKITFSLPSGGDFIPEQVYTDSNGYWEQTGFHCGTYYAVKPTKVGYYTDFMSGYIYDRDMSYTSYAMLLKPHGTITDSKTGKPIQGVLVTFVYAEEAIGENIVPDPVYTDSSGYWEQTGFNCGTLIKIVYTHSNYTFEVSPYTYCDSGDFSFSGIPNPISEVLYGPINLKRCSPNIRSIVNVCCDNFRNIESYLNIKR